MNKIIVSIAFLTTTVFGFSQTVIDRSKAPEPALASKINIGTPASYTLDNGLKVFVVENHKLPKVSFQLTIDKDPVLENGHVGLSSICGSKKVDDQVGFLCRLNKSFYNYQVY